MAERPAAQSSFARFQWYWLPVVLYLGVIFTISAQANLQPPLGVRLSDKLYHVLEYSVLGVLLARAIRAGHRAVTIRAAALAVGAGVLVGTADEIFQSYVPGRISSVYDVLADGVGVLLAQWVYRLAVRGRG